MLGRRYNSVPGFPPPPTPTQELQRAGRVGREPCQLGARARGLRASTHLRPVLRRQGRQGGSAGSSCRGGVGLARNQRRGRARADVTPGRGGPSRCNPTRPPAALPPPAPPRLLLPPRGWPGARPLLRPRHLGPGSRGPGSSGPARRRGSGGGRWFAGGELARSARPNERDRTGTRGSGPAGGGHGAAAAMGPSPVPGGGSCPEPSPCPTPDPPPRLARRLPDRKAWLD